MCRSVGLRQPRRARSPSAPPTYSDSWSYGSWLPIEPVLTSSYIASLLGFALIAAVVATLPRRFMNAQIRRLIEVGHHTSAQTALRLTMLVIVLLLTHGH